MQDKCFVCRKKGIMKLKTVKVVPCSVIWTLTSKKIMFKNRHLDIVVAKMTGISAPIIKEFIIRYCADIVKNFLESEMI